MKVAIQGQRGSFHEQAAIKYFKDPEISFLQTFEDVFTSVRNDNVDYGIVAIANNRYGFIPDAYQLLLQDSGKSVHITGEILLSIRHQLLAAPGADLTTISAIHSQAPAIGQCRMFIANTLPNATIVEEQDTAYAAKIVHDSNNTSVAAIASIGAAKLYNLSVIAHDIQDDVNNLTRFLVLRRPGRAQSAKGNKMSLLLESYNSVGSLSDVLLVLKNNKVNVSLLHSSFIANTEFKMVFYAEISFNNLADATKSIEDIKNINGTNIQVLGVYSQDSI